MTIIYPAVFKENKDGSYSGYFPDLEMCEFSGRDLNFAIDEAASSLYEWVRVELMEEENPMMPDASDDSDIQLENGEFIRNISIHFKYSEGWDE
jgi:predicted RNase H-like HicB family nuclease